MALINIDSALTDALRYIKSCPAGSGLEIMSYKRNRTVGIVKLEDDLLQFIENGYLKNDTTIGVDQLRKKLKTAIAREFPRSRKVRFFKFSSIDELERIHQKI